MKEPELLKEIKADFPNVLKYSEYQDNSFRRKVVKAKSYPIYMNLKYDSPRKNKWLVFYEARSKKEHGKLCRLAFVTYVEDDNGVFAILTAFINSKPHIVIYIPHFFKRYSERAGINKTGIPLIIHYFTYNYTYVYSYKNQFTSADTYIQEIYGSSKDGVALGLGTSGENVLFKTFITYDMSKGDQTEVFNISEKIRQEIHENTKYNVL